MSYPRDLDEYTDDELTNEIRRRAEHRRLGQCHYCGRPVTAEPCKFKNLHRDDPGTKPLVTDLRLN